MNLASQATIATAVVTILAILLYTWMGIRVGQMRGKHGVKAPAMTGHPEFERAFRVHMNTLEAFPVFFPLLWLSAAYFALWPWATPLLGLLWIVGRYLYMTGYMADPSKRSLGFNVALLAELGLLICTIIGLVQAWNAVTAA